MKQEKPVERFHAEDVCDNPAIICRTCAQYISDKNPCIPVNGDDTCLNCLEEAATLLKTHAKAKEAANVSVHGLVAPAE